MNEEFHLEFIECPQCLNIQDAPVGHTQPVYSYTHDCRYCGYTILESEWNNAVPTAECAYHLGVAYALRAMLLPQEATPARIEAVLQTANSLLQKVKEQNQ